MIIISILEAENKQPPVPAEGEENLSEENKSSEIDAKIESAAKRILKKYGEAFLNLAK